jgi:hypothetical protein
MTATARNPTSGAPLSTPATSYNIIIEFTVDPEMLPAFKAAYNPDGQWPQFLKQADGYIQSRLLADDEHDDVYLTIDRWLTKQHFNDFNNGFADAYRKLDIQLESVAGVKRRIGGYTAST